jgi:hypothetical protein
MSLKSVIANEPLRTYVYGVLLPTLALLVSFGLVDSSKVLLITAVASAVLVPTVTEAARGKVTPSKNCPGK